MEHRHIFSDNESQGRAGERMRELLKNAVQKNTDKEQTLRPKRKAATKTRQNPVIEDSASEELDDSFEDAEYKCPGEQSSSPAESEPENNNDVTPEKPTKSSSESKLQYL